MQARIWSVARRLGALLAIGLASTMAAGCGSSSNPSSNGGSTSGASFYTGWPTSGTPVRGGSITYADSEAPNSMDPFLTATGENPVVQVFDQLTELVPGTKSEAELKPALATSWTISPNHLVYTFHIREGVKFSNGEPVTGEDVAFSLQQSMLPTALARSLTTVWKKVSLVGPMTVQIQLVSPQAELLENIDTFYFAIVPKALYKREGATQFGLHPVGTGPFMVTSASSGNAEIVEKRNPYYWQKGKPYLDEIVFKQIENANARVLAVRSGSAEVAAAMPYSQASALKGLPNVKMLIGPVWGASYNFFNRLKAPFNEVDVRRALMYATPVNQIIKAVYKDFGTAANSPWGRLKYWDSRVPYYSYDLGKARELLKHSSVPNGFSTAIEVMGGEPEGEVLASILQASWSKIGVHVSINLVSSATLATNFSTGKYSFLIWPPQQGVSIVYQPDAAALAYFTTSAPGYGPKASPEFVAKANRAAASTDEGERAKLFGELQYDAYQKEAIYMPLVDLVSLNLASDKVRGFQALPNSFVPMENVWLQQ